jgi:Tfp pilus assembly protein PilV
MHKDQRGFSLIEGLLILAMVGLLGFIGWYTWGKRDAPPSAATSPPKTSQQNQSENKDTDHIRLFLVGATNAPIANTKVSIYSDNGTRCIQAPCPNNSKSWDGTTDSKGAVTVPKDTIQMATTITPAGYHGTALQYDSTKMTYEVKFSKTD